MRETEHSGLLHLSEVSSVEDGMGAKKKQRSFDGAFRIFCTSEDGTRLEFAVVEGIHSSRWKKDESEDGEATADGVCGFFSLSFPAYFSPLLVHQGRRQSGTKSA